MLRAVRELAELARAARARTGTAISAAAVGVGARRSAAWSISVVSVSWPTAEISGIGDSAAARTTSSSLNAHRSSIEPPPRATISRSGRGSIDAKAADRRGDLRRRALALDRHRPQDDARRAAVLEPVEDVADHRAGRRGDDADDSRQERQLALALGVEQPFGGERLAALLEQREQRALARQLHPLDDDLIFGAAGIGGELAGRDDLGAVLGPERERGRVAAPDHRVDAGVLVLQGEIAVARAVALEPADLAAHADVAERALDRSA